MRGIGLSLAVLVGVAACGGGGGDADQDVVQRVDSVALAAEAYDSAAFDTITWESEAKATERGGVVWAYSCQKCHGERGRGDAGFVMHGDTLEPPSFLAMDWEYASDPEGVRQAIFTGNREGMPHWGLVGLKPKDIEAVTIYILQDLRGGD